MTVIHATDPTTQVLALLYEQREDVKQCLTERSTTSGVQRAIRGDDVIMMLGHGNEHGLFGKPDKRGRVERLMINSDLVQFLRGKTCIGIWCRANQFAKEYRLHGLFSGMIVSEVEEAVMEKIHADKEEIDREIFNFTSHLRYCIDNFQLKEVPMRMRELDSVKSELTSFNYNNLYYYE